MFEGLYSRLLKLEGEVGHRRIYSQIAYPVVRDLQTVPAVHMESLDLAAWYPLVWLRDAEGLELLALRSFLPLGAGHSQTALRNVRALPLLLQAYPFACPPDQPQDAIFVDDAVADQPDNTGATILTPNGSPSRASAQRIYAAAYFRSAYDITRRMSAALDAGGLLEPWDMGLPADPPLGPFPQFLILRPAALASDVFGPFVHMFGLAGMRLLNAHALSLFRAGVLYQNARQAIAPQQLAGFAPA
ncbi:SapC family protein [Xanthobacter sp. DSM 24535]|uniref:SapC family protein n=1 Tax=Roseixanthobacter psychrophilus TaxID=3119917 RepID=UPI00372C81BF